MNLDRERLIKLIVGLVTFFVILYIVSNLNILGFLLTSADSSGNVSVPPVWLVTVLELFISFGGAVIVIATNLWKFVYDWLTDGGDDDPVSVVQSPSSTATPNGGSPNFPGHSPAEMLSALQQSSMPPQLRQQYRHIMVVAAESGDRDTLVQTANILAGRKLFVLPKKEEAKQPGEEKKPGEEVVIQ